MENQNAPKTIQLFSKGDNYALYQGNMFDMLDVIEPNSIDAIVTDPPYELNFMNKGWDNSGVAFQKVTWEKCFRVLKPGGYLLSFGGSRTYHRIACAIEDAGFEIRDTIMWLYGSGFPKSMNIGKSIEGKLTIGSGNVKDIKKLDGITTKVNDGFNKAGKDFGYRDKVYEKTKTDVIYHTEEGKQWAGWGTALKPAYEPIIVARKQCDGSCADNVMKYGVGGINIDECRIPLEETYVYKETNRKPRESNVFTGETCGFNSEENHTAVADPNGRFPANVILTYDETDYAEVCGGMPYTKSAIRTPTGGTILNPKDGWNNNSMTDTTVRGFDDNGSAARYFYCAKASKRDRDEGLDQFDEKRSSMLASNANINAEGEFTGMLAGRTTAYRNTHPTVKPVSLMSYLVRLVTPKGGTILDPFNGSGSTGKAAMYENKDRNAGYKYIGIELTPEYLPIADARIRFALGDNTPVEYSDGFSSMATPKSVKSNGQLSLFDLH